MRAELYLYGHFVPFSDRRDSAQVAFPRVNLARPGDLLLGITIISSHCASHPTVRGMANSTVNISGWNPIAW